MENGIMGIQPYAVLLGLLVIILGFIIFSISRGNRQQKKLLKMAEGKMLVDFWCAGGEIKTFLCEEVRGQVKPPKDYKDDPKRLKGVKIDKKVQETLNSEIDVYYTTHDFTGETWFPPMRPRSKQIKISKTAFKVGIPLPIMYYEVEKWNSAMLENLASRLIGLSGDEATLEVLDKQDHTFWNNLDKAVQMLQKIPLMQMACFAAAGAALLGMFFAWQASSNASEILKAWRGG